ncbi:class I SAM-dependent methyltransferase [Lacimicrobium alkaliphilum]|uniref:Crotonobetainyl-CoA--carnitine CoA-transferase n=1 Tax=Lacimicrobium alkaliphilum TaxID=1526571 RepID=A0ABQ1RLP8_9ALTE|nr:TylF/MycF/NovP-related O-methyltransferase [Lacimicrobium alkaliphilum]GGD72519.1 hypothetical protein GCM10011357_29420 [Lacimicrobium alkaliphilum]
MNTVTKNSNRELSGKSHQETQAMESLLAIHQNLLSELGTNWSSHSLVTMTRQSLSRILYYADLYQKLLNVPGVICEFGVQWGATLSQLISLRGIHEPYNYSRVIYGFDTFEGFSQVDDVRDGVHLEAGDYSTELGYEKKLDKILTLQESLSPLSHMRKFELIKGDAAATIQPWLERNPHAIIAMAIFDMDIYKPTKAVLEAILPRLTKGSILVFDELNHPGFPGETAAVMEVLGLNNIRLQRSVFQPTCAWAVFE